MSDRIRKGARSHWLLVVVLTGVAGWWVLGTLGPFAPVAVFAVCAVAPIAAAYRESGAGIIPDRIMHPVLGWVVGVAVALVAGAVYGLAAGAGLFVAAACSGAAYRRTDHYSNRERTRLAFTRLASVIGAPPEDPWHRWLQPRTDRDGKPYVAVRYDPATFRPWYDRQRKVIDEGIAYAMGVDPGDVVSDWPRGGTRGFVRVVSPLPKRAELTRELLDDARKYPGRFLAGVGRDDAPVEVNLDKCPHVLVTGGTGGGKSETMRSLVLQAAAWPSTRVVLLDTKRVDFLGLRNMPNVTRASSFEAMVDAVHDARAEIDRRLDAAEQAGGWRGVKRDRLVLVVDEASTLTMLARNRGAAQLLDDLPDVARRGREPRVHLVLGLQRPDVNLLPAPNGQGGEMRDNLGGRIVCGPLLSTSGAEMCTSSDDARQAVQRIDGEVKGRAVVEVHARWQDAQLFKAARECYPRRHLKPVQEPADDQEEPPAATG